MSDIYRLIFRGEVLEGQHPAVVRRRLGEQLAIDDERLDRLFSGQAIVVKAEADTAGAARWQALFRKAGARLRVMPIESAPETAGRPTDPGREASVAAGNAPAADRNTGSGSVTGDAAPTDPAAPAFDPDVLPVGSDVLREDEREVWQPREIDTSYLSLQDPSRLHDADVPAPPPPPDTSHLALMDP
jgi:hypothetical protein